MDTRAEIERKAKLHGGWVKTTILGLLAELDNMTVGAITQALVFTLPLGVSVNHMYLVTMRGVRLSDDARAFKVGAATITRNAAQRIGWLYPAKARLSLSLSLYMPNNRRADISNLIKATEDAVAEALGFDDQCIDRIVVERKGIDRHNPRCEVVLEVI